MADYFTHFSCLLDVGTPENAARALDPLPPPAAWRVPPVLLRPQYEIRQKAAARVPSLRRIAYEI